MKMPRSNKEIINQLNKCCCRTSNTTDDIIVPETRNAGRLTAREIFQYAMTFVSSILTLTFTGGYTKDDLAAVLIAASASRSSISSVCEDLLGAPTEGLVRHYLKKLELEMLESLVNFYLMRQAMLILPEKKLFIAIDYLGIPYYGSSKRSENEIRKSKQRQGTNRFHTYATAYVMLYGRRFTIAVHYVRKDEDKISVLDNLIDRIKGAGIKIACLFVDREFFDGPTIQHLRHRKIPFVMPVKRHGKKKGIKKLIAALKTGDIRLYTMSSRKSDVHTTFPIYVVQCNQAGKRGKRGRVKYGYVAWGVEFPLRRVHREYRRRFGIETSYRIINSSRARTSSRCPTRRFLLFACSVLLKNAWIVLKWLHLAVTRKGRYGKSVRDELLRYRRMLRMLWRYVEDLYGLVMCTEL